MSSEPSKFNANVNQALGSAQSTLGSAIGNHEMQAKGELRHAQGETEQKAAEAKGWVEGAVDSVAGTVKNAYGALTGNTATQVEGKTQQLKGDAQKAANS